MFLDLPYIYNTYLCFFYKIQNIIIKNLEGYIAITVSKIHVSNFQVNRCIVQLSSKAESSATDPAQLWGGGRDLILELGTVQ